MKKYIAHSLILLLLITNISTAQQISATLFNKKLLHEDFDQEGKFFPIITTTDNYFILDKGDYLLSRNNTKKEYAIIAKGLNVQDFSLKTAIRLGPSKNKSGSIGVILKAQIDGKGAIIIEFNKKREYRIKQLNGNRYTRLSGTNKNDGWIKNKLIQGLDEHNFIEIRTNDNLYDLYVNNKHLTSFFIPDYTAGLCGLIISPETKARISYYYIDEKGGPTSSAEIFNSLNNEKTVNLMIDDLNKKITTLEKNNTELIEINSSIQNESLDQRSINKELNNQIKQKEYFYSKLF